MIETETKVRNATSPRRGIATPCAFDETAAPASEAGLYHSQCYKFVGVATSLRECSAKCGPEHAPALSGLGGGDAVYLDRRHGGALRSWILARLVPERERQPEQLRLGGRRCRIRHRTGHAFASGTCLIPCRPGR